MNCSDAMITRSPRMNIVFCCDQTEISEGVTNCLGWKYDGVIFSREWKEALRDRYFFGGATTRNAMRAAIQ